MKKTFFRHILTAVAGAFFAAASGQNAPFQIFLEPLEIPALEGAQSYAFGQSGGKWLIVGGRRDGLHRRQPFAAFDEAGQIPFLTVVDPAAAQFWTASTASLPAPVREQFLATNLEFFEENGRLYVLGGYGYSPTAQDHVTHDKLTAIDVAGAIQAVVSGGDFAPHFRQIADEKFAVTGGRLGKIGGVFYLVGGQKFEGRYNPMGPTHGPGFFQEYTDAVRRFKILDDGQQLAVEHLAEWKNGDVLHRRDFNVAPQILPDGREGLTAFSGVFQKTVDLPHLDCVHIDSAGYAVAAGFSQHYNHYHCAFLPLFDAAKKEMHTVFFGGIAQFYDQNGTLTQDNDVPFVRTVARVTRAADGSMSERKLPVEMPEWLGAGAEFIPREGLPMFANGAVKMQELTGDTAFVGYIFGGIESTAANIFFVNNGPQSAATSRIFKVFLIKNSASGAHDLNPNSVSGLQMRAFPNPSTGRLGVKFFMPRSGSATLEIRSAAGQLLDRKTFENLPEGEQILSRELKDVRADTFFLVTLTSGGLSSSVRVVAAR